MHPHCLELGEHLGEEARLRVDPQHGAAARSRSIRDQRHPLTLLKRGKDMKLTSLSYKVSSSEVPAATTARQQSYVSSTGEVSVLALPHHCVSDFSLL